MKLIGLTGGIACGKSTAAKYFEKRGIPVIYADQLAHRVIEPGRRAYKKIVEEFGSSVLDSSGKIDRKKLGEIVFNNPEKLERLNQITHPEVALEAAREIARYRGQGVSVLIYEVPLLFEAGLESLFDVIITVYVPREVQRERLLRRHPELSPEEAEKRIDSQMPIDEKARRSDYILDNTGTTEELFKQIDELIGEIVV